MIKNLICIGILFMLRSWVQAQPYTSMPAGAFTVDQQKGCNNLTVTVNADPACNGVGCSIRYSSQQSFRTITGTSDSFTYTTPGVYYIKLVVGGTGINDSIRIEVFNNIPPAFDIYRCGGNEVSVKISDKNYDRYTITYDDGTVVNNIPANGTNTHTFATGGTHNITVKGIHNGALDNCNSNTKSVTIGNPLNPAFISTLTVLDQNQIKLDYRLEQNVQYRLEVLVNNTGTYQQVRILSNVAADTVKNLQTDNNNYCFRIVTYNACTGAVIYSNVICSTKLTAQAQNNLNRITWTNVGTGITSLQLTKITVSPSSSITFGVTSSPYSDGGNLCGTGYCYYLTSIYGNGSQSISPTKCVTAFSTTKPDAISNVSSQVNDSGVDLIWETPTGFTAKEFSIYYAQDTKLTLINKVASNNFSDGSYTPGSGACYKIRYTDICDNTSDPGVLTCPINLTGRLTPENSIDLNWTSYDAWLNGVSGYVIEKYNESGNLLATFNTTSLNYLDEEEDLLNQTYFYIIKAIPASATLPISVSNKIIIVKNPNLFHPSAFTPNGDMLNDIFNVFGQYIAEFEMNIFNRWGELLYTTTDLNQGWDGMYKGKEMPEGTYTFVANIKDLAGRSFKKSGSIVLLKKSK